MTLAQSGIVPDWIDKAADPCQDFFAHACGGFLKTAQIPPDRESWGAIQLVTRDNEEFLRRVLEDARPGDKIGDYYAACMDEPAIEKTGIALIRPMLDEIAKVKDGATAAHAVTVLHGESVTPFFDISPQQDFADATQVIAGLDQAAKDLATGDIFFLTYSGHGGQLPDKNGDEPDGQDETWCLYDGQLVDDELYAKWAKFKPGVRIFVLSDSCHSGSVVKLAFYQGTVLAGGVSPTEPNEVRYRRSGQRCRLRLIPRSRWQQATRHCRGSAGLDLETARLKSSCSRVRICARAWAINRSLEPKK